MRLAGGAFSGVFSTKIQRTNTLPIRVRNWVIAVKTQVKNVGSDIMAKVEHVELELAKVKTNVDDVKQSVQAGITKGKSSNASFFYICSGGPRGGARGAAPLSIFRPN